MPGSDWSFADPAAGAGGDGGSGAGMVPAPARTNAGIMAGKLDIPLFLREKGASLKATAKIRIDGTVEAGWRFAWIDGDPHLRAVLFEALRAPRNRRVAHDLLRHWGRSELTITLRQRTVVAAVPTDRFGEELVFGDGRLTIIRTFYTGAEVIEYGGGGIPLPDEEAKRAKRRDRDQARKLEESAAFHSPIRDQAP